MQAADVWAHPCVLSSDANNFEDVQEYDTGFGKNTQSRCSWFEVCARPLLHFAGRRCPQWSCPSASHCAHRRALEPWRPSTPSVAPLPLDEENAMSCFERQGVRTLHRVAQRQLQAPAVRAPPCRVFIEMLFGPRSMVMHNRLWLWTDSTDVSCPEGPHTAE